MFKRKILDYKKYVDTMPDHKKSSKPTNVGTQVDDMPECAKYENPYHRFASSEGDIQHWVQFNNMPDGMTTDQLLASIAEIEKQVVFSWLWDPASIGNLAYIALKSGHAELSARCSKQFERARQLSLEKPHLCEAWSVESARLATC